MSSVRNMLRHGNTDTVLQILEFDELDLDHLPGVLINAFQRIERLQERIEELQERVQELEANNASG